MSDTATEPAPIVTSRQRYTDNEILEALVVLDTNRGNVFRTARELDIPEVTLRQWARGQARNLPPELREQREQRKTQLANRFDGLAERLLDIADDKAEAMSAAAAIMGAAISVDKSAFLRGEATGHGASVNVTVNTVNVSAAVLSPQDVHQARSLLSSVLALPASSESLGGPSCDERGAVSLPERSETAQKALPGPDSFPDPPG